MGNGIVGFYLYLLGDITGSKKPNKMNSLRQQLLQRALELVTKLTGLIRIAQNNLPTSYGKVILDSAKTQVGTDASPNDVAPDEYGCAETVTEVLRKAGCNIPVQVSTARLYEWLVSSPDWLEVPSSLPGDIIIAPTGQGGKNGVANGHVGIVAENGNIMSNNSWTGRFEQNYTLASWRDRYIIKGGYKNYFFRKVA